MPEKHDFLELHYLSCKLELGFSDNPKKPLTNLDVKIPCWSIYDGLFILETVFKIDISTIKEINLYLINDKRGNTRVDYKNVRLINETSISNYRTIYRKSFRKNYLK
ncbi:MAG: hypothetical protein ACK479_10720 [Fluviicola sp.]